MNIIDYKNLFLSCIKVKRLVKMIIIVTCLTIIFSLAYVRQTYRFNKDLPVDIKEKLDLYVDLQNQAKEIEDSIIPDMNSDDFYYIRLDYALSPNQAQNDVLYNDLRDNDKLANYMLENMSLNINRYDIDHLMGGWGPEDRTYFYYSFLYYDESEGRELLAVWRDYVSGTLYMYGENLEESNIEESIRYNYIDSSKPNDEILKNLQFVRSEDTKSIQTQIDESYASLSEKERMYYSVFYLNEKVKISTSFVVKTIIISLLVSIAIFYAIYVISYLFNNKVKSANELRSLYHFNIIGELDKTTIGITLNKSEDRSLCDKMHKFDSTDYIKGMLSHLSDISVVTESDNMSIISDFIKDCNPSLQTVQYIGNASEGLEKMGNEKNILLVVQAGSTSYKDIEHELELYAIYGITVLGAIFIA